MPLALLYWPLPAAADTDETPVRGDAGKGAEAYEQRCTGCHSVDRNRIGPRHRGVFGREAGSVADFYTYSPALKRADFTWDRDSLDAWLSGPGTFVPGSRMGFTLSDAQLRADIIAYLETLTVPGTADPD